jgi:hypothetical protein
METVMRAVLALVCAPFLLCGPALAAEPSADAPIASAPADTDAQIAAYLKTSPDPLSATGEAPPLDALAPDRAVHGEVGVGIGTGGYRHAHATMIAPIGDIGTAAIAVSDTRFNGRFGPRESQSLSIGVALGQGAAINPAAAPCGALPNANGYGFEPLWASRLRAQHPADALACPNHSGGWLDR